MHRDKKVVAYTPYGRKRTVSILLPYVKRDVEAGLIDEYMLCMNTDPDQLEDVRYAHELAEEYDWVRLYGRPGPDSPPEMEIPTKWRRAIAEPKQLNTGRFCFYMQDPETVYIRLDDDIVWIHDDAIRNLVDHKLDTEHFVVFPTIWNNAISSWFLQKYDHPVVPMSKKVGKSAVDRVGWGDPRFAIELHGNLLSVLEAGEADSLLFDATEDIVNIQFSVSCFAVDGQEYVDLDGVLDYEEEEHFHTQYRPAKLGRTNLVVGNAHISHFSFFTQRRMLLERTDFLERYRALSEAL